MKLRGKVTAAAVIVLLVAGYRAGHQAITPPSKASTPPAKAVTLSLAGMPANELLANKMAAAQGWGTLQQACLDLLWDRESAHTWSPTVVDPLSGAYGIPQSLPPDKMADPSQGGGPDWRTTPATQIRWGLTYIGSVYGTPCAAWAHETAVSWY